MNKNSNIKPIEWMEENWHWIFFGLMVLLVLAMVGFSQPWKDKKQYNEKTGCPLDNQYARTVILIDTSNALNEYQIASMFENIEALWRKLELDEWLGVFFVDGNDHSFPKPVIARCNPMGESKWDWVFDHPDRKRRKYEEKFKKPIRDALEQLLKKPEQRTSPIMEMVAAVARYHEFDDSTQKRRLIIVSDMLQNVPKYSQYGKPIVSHEYYDNWKDSDYAQNVLQRGLLQGVDVEILYVKRKQAHRLQVQGHIEFWRRYFADLGGRLTRVTPI